MEEVEQICTKIAIMDKGKNIAMGTKEELKQMIKNTESISVEVLGLNEEHIKDIHTLPHAYNVVYNDCHLNVNFSGGKHNVVRLLDYFQSKNISFGSVYSQQPTLNDVFLEITGKELRD